MIRIAGLTLLAVALQETPIRLEYRAERGAKVSVAGDMTLKLKIEGTEALTNLVRSSMEFLSFSEIRIKGEGVKRAAKQGQVQIEFRTARVEGTYDDEPFGFDFERKAVPPDESNKLKQICWFLSMAGPIYRLARRGEYASNDPHKEAWGEAIDLAANAIVRLPEKPVAAGDEWTVEWKGGCRQKDNDGVFAFKQKAKLEKIEKPAARISFETTGKLEIPEAKRDKNAEVQESLFETKGTLTLNLDTGLVTAHDSTGAVRAKYKGLDPNTGETHELRIDLEVTSKLTPKD